MLRWSVILLAALLCSGCFVFDEMEKGEEILDQHYGHQREEEFEPPPARAPLRAPWLGKGDQALAWAQDAWADLWRPAPPAQDPNDPTVGCQLGRTLRFMRQSDCLVRGGQVVQRVN